MLIPLGLIPTKDQIYAVVQAAINEDLLFELARSIHLLPFQARKDAQAVFSQALRFKPDGHHDPPGLWHILHHRPEVIIELCHGYDYSEGALQCGMILREALKYSSVAAIILYDESGEGHPAPRLEDIQLNIPQTGRGVFWRFFGWMDRGTFEVSADAFATFRVSLLEYVMSSSDRPGYSAPAQGFYQRVHTYKLRPLLQQFRRSPAQVKLLCHQAPEHQAPRGDPAGPIELQCDGQIRG